MVILRNEDKGVQWFNLILSLSLLLGLTCFILFYIPDRGFFNLQTYIDTYSTNLVKMNNTAQLQKMIDWGLQRQLTWAVLILTFFTIFFTILFELRKMLYADKNLEKEQNPFFLKLLSGLEIFFSICIFIGMYMSLYYYKYVEFFEINLLKNYFVSSPLEWLFNIIPLILLLIFVTGILLIVDP